MPKTTDTNMHRSKAKCSVVGRLRFVSLVVSFAIKAFPNKKSKYL